MAVVDVTEATFADEVLLAQELVVVDYWADWCAPCKNWHRSSRSWPVSMRAA